jgi:RNA polymerase subunit RPABC4/transcription elongation factor Spt4
MRKRLRAAEIHISTSATQSTSSAPRAQTSQAECRAPQSQLSSEQIAAEAPVVAQAEAEADAIQFENRKEQKQYINNGGQKQETQLVAVNDKEVDRAQPPSADVIACARCNREISKDDKFCVHCGASVVLEKRASTSMLCSSCRQEIGTSDKFCPHCGASSSAPNSRVDEVATSPRASVKKKRTRKRVREPMATLGHSDTAPGPATLQREPFANIAGPIDEADPDGKRPRV